MDLLLLSIVSGLLFSISLRAISALGVQSLMILIGYFSLYRHGERHACFLKAAQ